MSMSRVLLEFVVGGPKPSLDQNPPKKHPSPGVVKMLKTPPWARFHLLRKVVRLEVGGLRFGGAEFKGVGCAVRGIAKL